MGDVIVWPNEIGAVTICYPTGELPLDEVLAKDCPAGAIIISALSLPQNQGVFFEAWELNNGSVAVNLEKAKQIGHTIRRAERAKEFAPLDIKATIPAEAAAAEAARQVIRDKYSAIQSQIDAAQSPDEIKAALGIN
jgi:hypothetical protein